MTEPAAIADLLIEPLPISLDRTDEIVKILSFDDHLLRRFGQLDWIRRTADDLLELRLRTVADEIWMLVEGKVECLCRDLRSGSPSENVEIRFEASEPTRILVPFGVAFGWRSLENFAIMLRCATHQDGDHPEDRLIPVGVSR